MNKAENLIQEIANHPNGYQLALTQSDIATLYKVVKCSTALVKKLGVLTWSDRNICFHEWLELVNALDD